MSKKILIVDDDLGIIKLVGGLLKSAGYEVLSATDGLDALVVIKRDNPDLVILDIMMPEMNGYDVCFHIKFSDELKHIPILILTVRERELSEQIGKRVGIEYMRKPFRGEEILEHVHKMLP